MESHNFYILLVRFKQKIRVHLRDLCALSWDPLHFYIRFPPRFLASAILEQKATTGRQDSETSKVKMAPKSNSEKGRKDERDENGLADHG